MQGEQLMIRIDEKKCVPCSRCVDVCPAEIFTWDGPQGKRHKLHVLSQELCIICGHCVAICPEEAIIHEQLPSDLFLPLEPVEITPDALRNLMLSRRSIRAYKPDPVPRSVLEQLLEVAIHAGTASNSQNVEFTVVEDTTLLSYLETLVIETLWNQLRKLGNPIMRKLARLRYREAQLQVLQRYYKAFKDSLDADKVQGRIFRGAPAAIMLHTPEKSTLNAANCALAIANMTVFAQTLGLGVCWVGFLVEASLRSSNFNEILEIPDSRKILGCLIVGYPKYTYSKSIPRKQRKVNWL